MDSSSSDSDLDIPLDQLPEYDAALADDFHQWSLKNSGQALGANHRIEMSKNFGIAKSRHRQREEEYKSVIKNKDKNKSKTINSKPKTQKITEPYQRVLTKGEADQSSDEDIQVSKKRCKSDRKKIEPADGEVFCIEDEIKKEPNKIIIDDTVKQTGSKESRKRKVSDRKNESEPFQHRERTKSNSLNRPQKMDSRDNRISSLPTSEESENNKQQIERQKKSQEQITKNKKRKEELLLENEELENKIRKNKIMIAQLDQFNAKLIKNGFNTPPKIIDSRRKDSRFPKENSNGHYRKAVTISSDEESAKPIWEQNWYKKKPS